MDTPPAPDAIRYLDLDHAYIAERYQRRVADRMQVARILAGRISGEEFAEKISDRSGEAWSRSKIANVETGRKRLTLADVELIAETFRFAYGLKQVTGDWLMGDAPDNFLGEDFPGYLNRHTQVIDLTGYGEPSGAGR